MEPSSWLIRIELVQIFRKPRLIQRPQKVFGHLNIGYEFHCITKYQIKWDLQKNDGDCFLNSIFIQFCYTISKGTTQNIEQLQHFHPNYHMK